jgi:predicted NAD-dependent protein-ADP-ribosyltransferase YbiA (DUF1768 family)
MVFLAYLPDELKDNDEVCATDMPTRAKLAASSPRGSRRLGRKRDGKSRRPEWPSRRRILTPN